MRLIPALVAVSAAVACSDSFKPTADNVPGIYTARTFTMTDSTGTTTDWITGGASLELLLAPGGLLGGQLVLPGVGPSGTNLIVVMTGTWELTGNSIHFTQTADTFVRNMPWVASENRLTGDHTFGGTRVTIVLTK